MTLRTALENCRIIRLVKIVYTEQDYIVGRPGVLIDNLSDDTLECTILSIDATKRWIIINMGGGFVA